MVDQSHVCCDQQEIVGAVIRNVVDIKMVAFPATLLHIQFSNFSGCQLWKVQLGSGG